MTHPLLQALPVGERYATRSKPAMVRVSHVIEDVLLRERLPARLYSGFQRLSLFLPEVGRYRRLAQSCQRVVVWGIADAEVPPIPNVTIVPLLPEDPLARAWFVVAVHPAYTSALVTADISGLPATGPLRDFEGAWTFDLGAVTAVERALAVPLGLACPAVEPSRDEMVIQLRHAEQAAGSLGRYLERSLAREREASAGRERLSRMIVHDLRGPLTFIGGISELLLDGAFGDMTKEQSGHIKSLIAQSTAMNDLIGDVLETYRMESGRVQADVSDVALEDMLGNLAQSSGLGDRLHIEIARDAAAVRADPRLLGRVLTNLLANARKYGGRGNVRLTSVRAGGTVAISVADEGSGIPEEALPHVFQPLRQGANAGPSTGAGLGLAFVRLAVQAMGGRVTAANQSSGGAQLTIELPAPT